ncbi:hypothetical protein BKA69DRAFT_1088211 [Paraphysoderma sedebokerense]|nr:hypothetical protein BKA69DRAFT_1088211 [Paraphysoderma sedebokerense]
MFFKILLLFFLCVCACQGNQIPSPWFVKSAATVDLPSTSADIIASTENGTHILAIDSALKPYILSYSDTAGIQFSLPTPIEDDTWWRDANLWTHWRNASAYGIRWDPFKGMWIKMHYSAKNRDLWTWTMDGTLNFIDFEDNRFDTVPFLSKPYAYPRIVTHVTADYYYLAVFNDPTIDSTNNATGFAILQYIYTNTPNSDSNYLNRQMGNLTQRAVSIEFHYTINTPFTPLTFDPATARNNTTTYYFHESKFDRNQFILRSRNQTHEIANTTIPFNVSFPYRIPYYDLQVSGNGVYTAVTTSLNLSYGLGETEIVITKHDHSLSRVQSAVIISTFAQDNVTRIIPLSNSFIVLGTTKGNLNSPTDDPYTLKLFALQFVPLNATVISSKPLTVMAYEIVQIQFFTLPAALQLTIPQVQFKGNNCTDVAWNGSTILAKIPEGVGGPHELWVRFDSLVHFKPSIRFDGLVYGQPVVLSVGPTLGPTVGFDITITANNIGIPVQNQIVVTIGNKDCLNVVQIDNNTITCQVPPGTGQNHILAVSVGPVSNSTEPFYISYHPPVIDQILPSSGPTIGNSPIYIIGNGFGNCNPYTPGCDGSSPMISVTISNKPCINLKLYNDTHIECLTPEGTGQNRTLMLQVNGQNASYLCSYQPPAVSSIIPTSILSANPTLYLEGFNFGGVNTLRNVVLTDTNSTITYQCPSLIYVSHNGVRWLAFY